MKNNLLLVIMTGCSLVMNAQRVSESKQRSLPEPEGSTVFIGAGLSMNDTGLNVGLAGKISPGVCLSGSVGLGLWGKNVNGVLEFYPSKTAFKSAICAGVKVHTGVELKMSLETSPGNQQEEVDIRFNPGANFLFYYAYNLHAGKQGKFQIYSGWSFDLTERNYTVLTEDVTLNIDTRNALEIMAPGGWIIGFRFMFGVN
jgi:hypothetical protein